MQHEISSVFDTVLNQANLDNEYIEQVFDYYREQFVNNKQVQVLSKSLKAKRGISHQSSNIGYCDRTLGSHLSSTRSYEGAAIRGCLMRYGLIKATGHELFRSCVVFPEYEGKKLIGATGIRVAMRIRHWEKDVIRWVKPEPNAYIHQGMALIRQLVDEKTRH